MKINPLYSEKFEARHNAPDASQIADMLKVVKASSVDELIDQTVPANIRLKKALQLPAAQSEFEFLRDFKKLMSKNKIYKSYIGTGYYNCITPGVILRNVLENPGWYTAYTPYQAEIAQGRMEALINYQTMIIDLTGMEIAPIVVVLPVGALELVLDVEHPDAAQPGDKRHRQLDHQVGRQADRGPGQQRNRHDAKVGEVDAQPLAPGRDRVDEALRDQEGIPRPDAQQHHRVAVEPVFEAAPAREREILGRRKCDNITRATPIQVARGGVVDGVLDESSWATAAIGNEFVQNEPRTNEPSNYRSEVRILYSDNAIHVGAVLYDDPDSVMMRLSGRDQIGITDWFGIVLDPYESGRNGFEFIVTAAGVQFDAIVANEEEDENWHAVWHSAAKVTEQGWVAEMSIPYSAFRFPKAQEHVWSMQLMRLVGRTREKSFLNPIDPLKEGFYIMD